MTSGSPSTIRPTVLREARSRALGRLILVHGCFHHRRFRQKDYDVLADGCRKEGFRGTIEGVFWDSFDFEELAVALSKTFSDVIKGKKGGDALPALVSAFSRSWEASVATAVATGRGLGRSLLEEGDALSVVLVGHSLGCRVIKACLEMLTAKGVRVREVHLLGAAVPAVEPWSQALEAVGGMIWNYHSRRDHILNMPYPVIELLGAAERLTRRTKKAAGSLPPLGLFFLRPAGLGGIDQDDPRLVNVDVSRWVTTHAGFEEHAFAFLKNIS